MSILGGRLWLRGAALLLVGAGAAGGLSGCEYADEGSDLSPASAGPIRSAPPPPPAAPPYLADNEKRNFKDLESILGTRPDGVVLEGAGGLGGGGFRKSAKALAKGLYTVTAICIGAPTANFSISQAGLRDGGSLALTLDCGKATTVHVDIAPGAVQAQSFQATNGPGTGAVGAFWMVPTATGS